MSNEVLPPYLACQLVLFAFPFVGHMTYALACGRTAHQQKVNISISVTSASHLTLHASSQAPLRMIKRLFDPNTFGYIHVLKISYSASLAVGSQSSPLAHMNKAPSRETALLTCLCLAPSSNPTPPAPRPQ